MIIDNKAFYDEKVSLGRLVYKCKCDNCGCEFLRRIDKNSFDRCVDCALRVAGTKTRIHGETTKNSRLYCCWMNIKKRCNNKSDKKYKDYGALGIKMCKDWEHDYVAFSSWARANGYTDLLTIDRIDGSKGYSPDNCRWVGHSTQNANKGLLCTNTSGYTGVSRKGNRYVCKVVWKRKEYIIGNFDDKVEAAKERDKFIIKMGLPHKLSGLLDV